ncbi:MAG: carboxypeptidase regulatory-like domain-containing protein [Deltaproteobacteria bacterium]|nr:carboxypeptidase regulatory-like domain-containing protein [Deltaproteobacteria bacterium]
MIDKRVLAATLLVAAGSLYCGSSTEPRYTFQGDEGDQKSENNTFNGNDTTINNVGTETTNPTGTVQGLVLDDETGSPLENVAVIALAGGKVLQTTTDANGAYAFTEVPSSSSQLSMTFNIDGYTRVTAEVVVGTKDGQDQYELNNFTENVNIRLFPLTAALKGTVLTASRDAAPAKNADVVITTTGNALVQGPSSSAAAVATFKFTAKVQTTDTGDFLAQNLPGGSVVKGSCVILPYDEDNDGVTDYDSVAVKLDSGLVGGETQEGRPGDGSVPLFPGVTTDVGPIHLVATNGDDVHVVYTNIDRNGSIQIGQSIIVVFSDDLRQDTLLVFVETDDGNVYPEWTLDHNALTIPTEGLKAGNLILHLQSYESKDGSVGGPTLIDFKATGGALPAPANLTISSPDADRDGTPEVDYNTTGITLSFDPVPGAAGYLVFGAVTSPSKFDAQGAGKEIPQSFILLTMAPVQDTLFPKIGVNLSDKFDVFENLPQGHPFLGGQKITLLVRAVDATFDYQALPKPGEGIEGSVTLADNVAPKITAIRQFGSANNMAGTDPAEFRLEFTFSEPMDPSSGINITWSDAGQPAPTHFIGSTTPYSTEVSQDGMKWTLRYKVPGGADWSGDGIANMTSLLDTSSNPADLPAATDLCGLNPVDDGPNNGVNLYPKPLMCRW